MASFPSPQRDPLIDHRLQEVLNQRGKELVGLILLALALGIALALATHSPQDPGWMAATDAPVNNALGRLGAAMAGPLFTIAGLGAWGLALAPAIWGLRLLAHLGDDLLMARIVFAPVAVAVATMWLASLVPPEGWNHDFGLGGMFGDTLLAAVLTILSSTAFMANVITLVALAMTLAVSFYALGGTRAELVWFAMFLVNGLILSYAGLASVLGLSVRGMGHMALRSHDGWQARRDQRAQARAVAAQALAQHQPWSEPPASAWSAEPARQPEVAPPRRPPTIHWVDPRTTAAQPDWQADPYADPYAAPAPPLRAPMAPPAVQAAPSWSTPERGGVLSRVAALARRPTEPEPYDGALVAPELPLHAAEAPAPSPERIRSRIAELMTGRPAAKPVLRFDPQAYPGAPGQRVAEPPLTAPPPVMTPSPRVSPVAPPRAAPKPEPTPKTPRYVAPVIEDDEDEDDDFDDRLAQIEPPPRPHQPGVLNRRVVQTPARRPAVSRQAQAEAQPRLPFEPVAKPAFELPPLSLLRDPALEKRVRPSAEALEENARMLESVLEDYGVRGEIVSVRPGPVVTLYELEPAPGLKASRVIGLSDDIARSMSALSARVSTVPGRSVIGIELPNDYRQTVVLREILAHRDFGDGQQRLPLALGKDIGDQPVVANLAKMPHLLIAGTTGSGKSVAINTMILSLLYKLTPQECRLIMIDPKMLELSVYDGIPHLLSPVVTDPKKAVVALKWVVGEMEERYRRMSKMGVRNIDGYNGRVREALANDEMFKRTVQTGFDDETGDPMFETEEFAPELLPYIVVIVDEMADLMMVAGKEIEACIQRLAQMARASGIHLIMATQRPSVDVITGTIKANFPTRISFQVTSKIDSRTILGEQGAEQLLGMGDMLYMAGGAKITRVHGPFVSDGEVEEVVAHLKSFGPAQYVSTVLESPEGEREADIDAVLGLGESGGDDALYDQAVAIVARDRKCSTSYIQRKLGIGYNKAARLVEQMEQEGVVSTANHVGKREILVPEG